jgi:hypothetical protein
VGGRGQKGAAQVGSAARAAIGELPGNTVRRDKDIFHCSSERIHRGSTEDTEKKGIGEIKKKQMTAPEAVISYFLLLNFLLFLLFLSHFFFSFFSFFSVFSALPW